MDKQMQVWRKESDEKMRQYIDKQRQESDERMQRYSGALKEDSDHRMDAIFEYVKDMPSIKRLAELTFEKVGELAVDHEVRAQKLESHFQG